MIVLMGAVHGGGISIGQAASLLGALVALLALLSAGRSAYARTFGRRRDRRRRLGRLGTGAQLSFFVSALGEPPAVRRTVQKANTRIIVTADDPRFDATLAGPDGSHQVLYETRTYGEAVFIDRDYYVQTITNADETVLAFSVTTRSKRFSPRYRLPFRPSLLDRRRLKRRFNYDYEPLLELKLGRTTFADLDRNRSDHDSGPQCRVSVGAHNWSYSEFRPLGNPGSYQTVVLTASDVGAYVAVGNYSTLQAALGGDHWPPDEEAGRSWEALGAAHEFRGGTVITTYTVVGMDLWVENYPATFGPYVNYVRTIP